MAYNNYYGNSGGSSFGRSGFGYNNGGGYGPDRQGGYSSFRREEPIFFPSQANRQDMYKSGPPGRFPNQEQRRRNLLEEQRNRRSNTHNRGRFGQHQNQPKKKKGPTAPPKPREYKDILSYSEYLVERPDDLEQWVVVACPKGKRCTLVAHKGITTSYDKSGRPTSQFPSNLPGGCDPAHLLPTHGAMRKTILDCIYSESDDTFYVLDIIMWNLHPFVECETSLRFFWLQTRLQEVDVTSLNKTNRYRILPAVRFNVIDMQAYLLQPGLYPDNRPPVDGFLFYHPEAIYMSGTTPLLNTVYLSEKPADYTNLQEHVAQHGNSYGQKKKKKKAGGESMETDGAGGGNSASKMDLSE
ncbi:hypothetical protein M8J75_009563 [Diaphorina citri]|nr:hypothetical protein M8J75_009563 [Diaphorina citri]